MIKLGVAIVLLVACVALIVASYVKAPPDTAYIITGFRKPRILIGKAGLKIPLFERLDKLTLKMFSVDVKTTDYVPNAEYINVRVDASVKLRVGQSDEMISLASKFFLNEDEEEIIDRVQDTLEGNMREIVGQMTLSEMVTNRQVFADRVRDNAIPDLEKMGLELLAFNVQSFTDQNDVIDDLGIENVSKIKKDAAITRAKADKEVSVAQAHAAKEANDAKVQSEMEIAEKNNALIIRKAELKQQSDTKRAEADAAYSIKEQEQRKAIEVASENANIAKAERRAELKAKEVEVKKQTLDADVRAAADAELYRRKQEADAELYEQQRSAEAARYIDEQEALADMKKAEAMRYVNEQKAEGIAAVGKAEAQAIKAKALAEAEGIDKKAEAMRKMGEAAVIEMIMGALPEIAKNVAAPLANVDKITMYGEGNSTKLISDIVNSTNQVTTGITEGMGIDLKALLSGMIGGKLSAPSVVVNDYEE